MDFDKYQRLAARTAVNSEDLHKDLIEAVMGAVGEAAEVMEHVKKAVYQGHELDKKLILSEVGDTLWYLSETCRRLGLSLGDAAEGNIVKLWRRYPEGFEYARSVDRKE